MSHRCIPATGLPTGVTAAFSPASVTTTSKLTLTVSSTATKLTAARRALVDHTPRPEGLVEVRIPVPDRPRVIADIGQMAAELGINIVDLEIAHSLDGVPAALFPLAGALLLPRGQMPLNIFEPRYLAMVDDALRDGASSFDRASRMRDYAFVQA